MATQLGTGHIHSLTGAAVSCSLSGYVSPNLQSLRAVHNADVDRIKGQSGKTTGAIYEDDTFECTFEFIPEGTTVANAKLSAGLPAAGTGFTLSGLAVVTMGGTADIFNSALWIYEGGGQLNGAADGKWTATLPLRRYPQITSLTAIT
jgi:hypothetical protein